MLDLAGSAVFAEAPQSSLDARGEQDADVDISDEGEAKRIAAVCAQGGGGGDVERERVGLVAL